MITRSLQFDASEIPDNKSASKTSKTLILLTGYKVKWKNMKRKVVTMKKKWYLRWRTDLKKLNAEMLIQSSFPCGNNSGIVEIKNIFKIPRMSTILPCDVLKQFRYFISWRDLVIMTNRGNQSRYFEITCLIVHFYKHNFVLLIAFRMCKNCNFVQISWNNVIMYRLHCPILYFKLYLGLSFPTYKGEGKWAF